MGCCSSLSKYKELPPLFELMSGSSAGMSGEFTKFLSKAKEIQHVVELLTHTDTVIMNYGSIKQLPDLFQDVVKIFEQHKGIMKDFEDQLEDVITDSYKLPEIRAPMKGSRKVIKETYQVSTQIISTLKTVVGYQQELELAGKEKKKEEDKGFFGSITKGVNTLVRTMTDAATAISNDPIKTSEFFTQILIFLKEIMELAPKSVTNYDKMSADCKGMGDLKMIPDNKDRVPQEIKEGLERALQNMKELLFKLQAIEIYWEGIHGNI